MNTTHKRQQQSIAAAVLSAIRIVASFSWRRIQQTNSKMAASLLPITSSSSSIFQPRFTNKKILHGFKWTQYKCCHYNVISLSLFATVLFVFWFHLYPMSTLTLKMMNNSNNDKIMNHNILLQEQKQQQQQQPQQKQQNNKNNNHHHHYDDHWSYSSIPYFDTIMETVDLHFPGAMPSWTTLQTVKHIIEQKQYGLTPSNTLFAQSICPDEINHEPNNSISNLFAEYLGEVYHLGGLGAIPFTGKTGFAAYASHVPYNGHLFVLLAPHIGISDNGRHLGQYTRSGQTTTMATTVTSPTGSSASSTSTSPISSSLSPLLSSPAAAIGTLGHLPDMAATNTMDESDQQMAYLTQHINQHRHEILDTATTENAILATLTRVNHDIALDYLHKIIHVNFGNNNNNNIEDDNINNNSKNNNSTLLILTGIQINMPRPALQEFFQPLTFTIHYQNGTVMDLFDETFKNNNNTQSQQAAAKTIPT